MKLILLFNKKNELIMEQLTKGLTYKTIMTFLMIAFFQTLVFAQDNEASSSTTTKSVKVTTQQANDWYASPLVWVIGAAVLILLIIALMRGGRSSGTTTGHIEKVTVTKSSSTD